MDYNTKQLWERIQQYQLDDPEAEFYFSARLARENGWEMAYTERVVAEYKRFLLLCAIVQRPLVPSDAVNQAWCLHLVYTRSYWGELCGGVLGFQLHHYLAKTAPKELLAQTYEETLALYQKTFGEHPHMSLWPAATERFVKVPYRRVNVKKVILIPRPQYIPKNLLLLFIIVSFALIIPGFLFSLWLGLVGFVMLLLGFFISSNSIKEGTANG